MLLLAQSGLPWGGRSESSNLCLGQTPGMFGDVTLTANIFSHSLQKPLHGQKSL